MNLESFVKQLSDLIIGWPLMIFVVAVSLLYTYVLGGVQFRYFFTAFKTTLFPSQTEATKAGEVSSFHAFINTVNSNLGNGSIAGMGTAVYTGGPGSVFWVVIFGFILMAVRFAEVYVSSLYEKQPNSFIGGPMLYLRDVIGGKYLSYAYGICALTFGLLSGCAMQANSIQVSLNATWGISPLAIATTLLLFVLYILFGGAERIVKISLAIVPVKVFVFVISSTLVLMYHYQSLFSALVLIVKSGFGLAAFGGGVAGFSLQYVIGAGMMRSIFATESGLGSAAILFGSSGNDGIKNGMMGMISTFISTLVCFVVGLCIVVSGTWSSGFNSTALTIAAFDTVFGAFGGWIVSFLSVSFGFGVLVAYAYVVRTVWLFLTNNRLGFMFTVLYSLFTFGGALASIALVWDLCYVVVGTTLAINLFGLVMLMPKIRKNVIKQLRDYKA